MGKHIVGLGRRGHRMPPGAGGAGRCVDGGIGGRVPGRERRKSTVEVGVERDRRNDHLGEKAKGLMARVQAGSGHRKGMQAVPGPGFRQGKEQLKLTAYLSGMVTTLRSKQSLGGGLTAR